MLSGMSKVWLGIAQVLGVFPAGGLWFGNTVSDLKFKKLSFQFLYSIFVFIVRLTASLIIMNIFHKCLIMGSSIVKTTDGVSAIAGIVLTFCIGSVYHITALTTTPEFIVVMQKIDDYDVVYGKPSKRKICSWFLTQNLVFILFTIGVPVIVTCGVLLTPRDKQTFMRYKAAFPEESFDKPVTSIIFSIWCALFSEFATAFPVIQLGYFINSIEQRFKEIYEAVVEHKTSNNSTNDWLLDLYTAKWASKKEYGNMLGSDNNKIIASGEQKFWKSISKRYLDCEDLFSAFISFAGPYFIVIYPVQILSCIFMIYITSTNLFNQTEDSFLFASLQIIIWLGLQRIWALCNVGRGIEQIHSRILRSILRVDTDAILSQSDRQQYEKFVQIVKSIPLEMNASGFFNVSRSNVPSILTALVSYIIVLFQFRGSEGTSTLATTFFANITGPEV